MKRPIRAGLAMAKSRGKKLGRPSICDDAAVKQLRGQGCSMRKIAKELNLSVMSVHRSLSRK